MTAYRIFLSSPGDVFPERERAQKVVERLNAERPAAPFFALTRWEQSFYTAETSFQTQIRSPGEHDIVVFIFWKRLGTDLGPQFNRADGTQRTGTEYEFEEARDARERRTDHLPDILVYRSTAKITFSEEFFEVERAQKKSLDQFWEKWFRSRTGHFLAGFQSFADASDFERQFERNLRDWLQRRSADHITWDISRQGSPYRGLDAIDESHAELFFGRDLDMDRARARWIEAAIGKESGKRGTPFLMILGASGAGKSSFLRAGLIPRMRTAGMPAFKEDGSDAIDAFRSLVIMPREMGESLCQGLARALFAPTTKSTEGAALPELSQGDFSTPEAFAGLGISSPDSIAIPVLRALDRAASQEPGALAPNGSPRRLGLILGIDQLEEVFSRSAADRSAFVRMLGGLLASGRVFVAATMRNDFYDRLRQDADLSQLTDRGGDYDLAPPTLADYRDIIRRPAQAAGLRFEAAGERDLASEIEAEAGSEGSLPMIAFLLDQLFSERDGDLLTFATYEALGGAAGALAKRGDQVFAQLPRPVQDAFPRVVRRLVRKSLHELVPTAAPARMSSFPDGSPERLLVDALCGARLLRTFTVSGADAVKSSYVRWGHEALLTRWPRLRDSVDADRRDYETLDRLHGAHSLWLSTPAPQKNKRLLVALALVEAEDLIERWGTDVDEALRDFVTASRRRAQNQRRLMWGAVAATVTLLVVMLMNTMKQRDLARTEESVADRTAAFMVALFEVADPSENRGDKVTVREMLDRGASEVTHSQDLEARTRADLLTAMGQAYSGLGLYAPAEKLLSAARDDQQLTSVPAASQAKTLIASGTTLYLAGDYSGADKLLNQAVDVARRDLPTNDVLRSKALDALADVLVQQGNYTQARALCTEALAEDRKRDKSQAAVLAHTLDTLGVVDYYSGDLHEGEAVMREALALHLQASGQRDTETAQAMERLASLLYQSGQYPQALAMYQTAVPIYQQVYGAEHPEVAVLLISLGRTYLTLGDIDRAEPLLRQALAMAEKLKGPEHDDLVAPLNSLAMIDGFHGNFKEAMTEAHRAEQVARVPNQGELLDQVLLNIADLQIRSASGSNAANLLTEAHQLLEKQYPLSSEPAEAWRYSAWNSVRAELLATQADAKGARDLMDAATPVVERQFGPKGFDSQVVRLRQQFVEQRGR